MLKAWYILIGLTDALEIQFNGMRSLIFKTSIAAPKFATCLLRTIRVVIYLTAQDDETVTELYQVYKFD